nr:hypothetical protein [Tanacetum cinerariifolium]
VQGWGFLLGRIVEVSMESWVRWWSGEKWGEWCCGEWRETWVNNA